MDDARPLEVRGVERDGNFLVGYVEYIYIYIRMFIYIYICLAVYGLNGKDLQVAEHDPKFWTK